MRLVAGSAALAVGCVSVYLLNNSVNDILFEAEKAGRFERSEFEEEGGRTVARHDREIRTSKMRLSMFGAVVSAISVFRLLDYALGLPR